jgi:Protein of unknown function (DUF3592)
MTGTATGGVRVDQRWRRGGRILGGVIFALAPWVSLGFATPITFLIAAILFGYLGRSHAIVLWVSAALYTVALIAEIAESSAASGTTGDYIFDACLLATTVIGGLQALAFALLAAVKGYRPTRRAVTPPTSTGDARTVEGARHTGRRPASHPRPSRSEVASDAETPVAPLIFGAVLTMALAVGLTTHGIQHLGVSADLDHRGVSAAATVVAVKHESTSTYTGTRDWTTVTVAFTDAAGTARRAAHEGRDNTHVGDRLTIVYDPQNPTHVRWDTDVDETDLDLGFAAASAAVALGLTILAAINARRRRTRTPR